MKLKQDEDTLAGNELESIDRIIAPQKKTIRYYLKRLYKRLFRRTLIYGTVKTNYCRNINDCNCYDIQYICRNCNEVMESRSSNCLVLHPPNEICITCEHCGSYRNNTFDREDISNV